MLAGIFEMILNILTGAGTSAGAFDIVKSIFEGILGLFS